MGLSRQHHPGRRPVPVLLAAPAFTKTGSSDAAVPPARLRDDPESGALQARVHELEAQNRDCDLFSAQAPGALMDLHAELPLHVLIVDDHRRAREAVAERLGRAPDLVIVGYCSDGLTAVDGARDLQPDLILMDIQMPTLDGIAATRRIKTRWPAIKVIGLALPDEYGGDRAICAAGADACILKTTAAEELLSTIRAIATECGASR
jgi:CheY-like chemotaxis protein